VSGGLQLPNELLPKRINFLAVPNALSVVAPIVTLLLHYDGG